MTEIVGAVQFAALPRFGLPEVVKVGRILAEGDFELRELAPQLPPLEEAEPGRPDPPQLPQLVFGIGQRPQRALYFKTDGRFVAQLQRDRIAVNERRNQATSTEDPSSEHVWPVLAELSERVQGTLVPDADHCGPRHARFVELTYVNTIRPAEGVWQSHGELHRVLRIMSVTAGEKPWAQVERAAVRFSFPLYASDRFCGRLHVAAEPAYAEEGAPILNLNLISRRRVEASESLREVFDACHCDAVHAFLAITTPEMHEKWGRTR